MARLQSIPLNTYPANTYGPFNVDGRQIGDAGVRINIQRGAAGAWPLTPADPVLTVLVEYQYDGSWSPAAQATFTGGTQQDRWGAGTKLSEFLTVKWPQRNVGGVLYPMKPDAARATFIVHQAAEIGGSVQWLSL